MRWPSSTARRSVSGSGSTIAGGSWRRWTGKSRRRICTCPRAVRGSRSRPRTATTAAQPASADRRTTESLRGPRSLGALLTQELLDLGDQLGRRRKVASLAWLDAPRLLGVARLELLDVGGDLRVLGDDLGEVPVELAHGLVEIREVERDAEQRQHALDERQRRLRVLAAGDVVGHVRPEARRREPVVPADGVDDADDAGGAFVG